MASKLTLTLVVNYGVSKLQIFGDSLLVIKWVKKENMSRNFTLHNLMDENMSIVARFNGFSHHHIYKERKQFVDDLSKNGICYRLDSSYGCAHYKTQGNLKTRL